MYLPRPFEEQNDSTILNEIWQFPLATLVVALPQTSTMPFHIDHLPLLPARPPVVDEISHLPHQASPALPSDYCLADIPTLHGHLARNNPLIKRLESTDEEEQSLTATAIFHGEHRYISPRWYPSIARGKEAVPTWNYRVVHVHGTLTLERDPERIRQLVSELGQHFERQISNGTEWRMEDSSAAFIEGMIRGIVGITLTIEHIEAKTKASQNRSQEDRDGVRKGLQREGVSANIIDAVVKDDQR